MALFESVGYGPTSGKKLAIGRIFLGQRPNSNEMCRSYLWIQHTSPLKLHKEGDPERIVTKYETWSFFLFYSRTYNIWGNWAPYSQMHSIK